MIVRLRVSCLAAALWGHHADKPRGLGLLLPHHVGVHALLTHHGGSGHAHGHAVHLQYHAPYIAMPDYHVTPTRSTCCAISSHVLAVARGSCSM